MTVDPAIDRRVARRLELFVRSAGIMGLLVGVSVVLGYAAHLPILTTLYPGLQGMSVLTALGLGLVGAALLAESLGHRLAAKILGAPVVVLAAVLLGSHALFGTDVVDPALSEGIFAYDPRLAGRTSVATATGLLLLAGSLQFDSRTDFRGLT